MTVATKRLAWIGLALVPIALLTAACGGGGNDSVGATFSGQPVTCDGMNEDSYRFVTTINFKVDAAPTPTPAGVAPGPGAVELTQKVEGQVEDGSSYQADYFFIEQYSSSQTTAVRKGDKYWIHNASGWREETGDIPYRAITLCESMAPDLDVTAPHTAETVNGISSERFDLTDWATTWADRAPEFGSGSDVGSLIETFSGSVWIAHSGNYINKVQLTGQGVYPDGSVLHIDVSYDITDRGASIKIKAPI